MAAKWQQWMPLHVDRWRGSPAVKSMHPAARSGYLDLLLSQWQSDDCTIPNDPIDLADLSGLGDELWAIHGARILRNFVSTDVLDRLRNEVCFEEWQEAKRIFEARQASAHRTNISRSSNGHRAVTDGIPSRSADTITGTVTVTETIKTKNLTPARQKRRLAKKASPPTKTEITDARHALFKAAIWEYWKSKNTIDCPWGVPEGRSLAIWLKSCPNITLPQFTEFLRNRYRSDVNHAERPSLWISRITNYANGPVKSYGGNGNGKPSRAQAELEAALRLIDEQESNSGDASGHGPDAGREDGQRANSPLFLAARQRAV